MNSALTHASTAGYGRSWNTYVQTLGRHLIVELYGCEPRIADDVRRVRRLMLTATRKVGATVIGEVFHHFAPQGVTGSVVIAESHLSVHTWPEHGYVSIDVFTCGGLDPMPAFTYLAEKLGARASRVVEILRGLDDDVARAARLLPARVHSFTRMSRLRRLRR